MGLTEQVATLNEKIASLEAAQVVVADDIAALKAELVAANEAGNVDLSGAIAKIEAIEAGLRASAGGHAGSDPTPAPEPPPE